MGQPRKSPKSSRSWLWHVLITVAVVIGMMGLVRIDPLFAWLAAAIGLAGLAGFFYLAGRVE
ncbi:hypothetical protein [Qipengyuania sp. SM2507]